MNDQVTTTETEWALEVDVRLEAGGARVARERVRPDDLDEARSELWRDVCLRNGLERVPLDAMETRLEPVAAAGDSHRWCGYRLVITGGVPRERHGRARTFTVHSLERVAERAVQRLVTDGVVQAITLYTYEIVARRVPATGAHSASPEDASFHMTTTSRPLDLLRLPLAPIRTSAAEPSTGMRASATTRDPFPVFFTRTAHAAAERVARRGMRASPPVETGGVLVGPVCVCPDTGELYVVVTDVIEAIGAEEEERSLAYSGHTWQHVRAVAGAIRSREGHAFHRLLGQVHGHNFVPADGAPPCARCHTVEHCTRTSVFVSGADAAWSDAVFCRQPWKLCHIFGLNARRERVEGLFGLDDGRLRPRPFHLLDTFDPIRGATAPEHVPHADHSN